jgi:mRNA interferase RelE/StbE
MHEVLVSAQARTEFLSLPVEIQRRVEAVFERLKSWPEVSGAKPLKHELKGAFRVRTGNWRVLFRVDEHLNRVIVFRLAHRREVYE